MALSQTAISQLYVAIFNRASEGEGNTFWQTFSSTDSAAEVATAMLATSDAQEYFGDSLDTNQAFIEAIYLNTLNKTPADDQEGIDYWVGRLEAGESRGQIVSELVSVVEDYADSTDPATIRAYNQFTNRVEVSNYTAENLQEAPADYATSLNFAADLTVTDDDATVASAQASVDAIVNPEEPATGLTAALNTLSDAQEAETAFLESAPELDSTSLQDLGAVANGAVDVDAGEATAQNIKDYYVDVAEAVGDVNNTNVADFEDKTAAVQDSFISAQQTSLSADVDAAAADLPAGQADLLATVSTREEAVVEALVADNTQLGNLNAEISAFNTANGSGLVDVDPTASPATNPFVELEAGVTEVPGTDEVLVLTASQYDETADYSPGYLLIGGTIYEGQNAVAFADLEAAARSSQLAGAYADKVSSAAAVESAKTALEAAVEDVILAETEAFELVSDLDDAGVVTYTAGGAGVAAVDVDVTNNKPVDVYQEEADKEVEKKEVFTLDIGGTYADGDSIAFDATNVAITTATGTTNEDVVNAVVAETYTNWDVAKTDADTVTFTAKEAGDVTPNPTVTVNSTNGTGTVNVTTEGVNPDLTSVDADGSAALAGALEAQSDFAELVSLFQEARDLNTEILALEEAITEATAAIENDVDDAEAPGLGITLVDFASATLTAESEVILFEDAEGTTVTLNSFGSGGEDQIFFGEGYSLVQIPDGDDINDNVGDSSALEILWSEAAGTLTLYVEAESFGGNSAATADVTEIELTGVSAEDITFEGGFLSAGTAA